MVFALFVKCFFYVLFQGVFLGDGMKGYGVLWNIVGMVRVVQVSCVLQSASGRPSPAWAMHGGEG